MALLTYEDVYKTFNERGCQLLSETYVGVKQRLEYRCSCGELTHTSFDNFRRINGCKYCRTKKATNRTRLSHEYVSRFFRERGCTLLASSYKNNRTPMEFVCVCGRTAKIAFNHFSAGERCALCGGKAPLNAVEVVNAFRLAGYVLVSPYKNAKSKVTFVCSRGHVGHVSWTHFKRGQRCRACYLEDHVGQGSPSWNTSIPQEERVRGRRYYEYSIWRRDVLSRDRYSCVKCGARGISLQAHHIESYASNRALRTAVDNGATLCTHCHRDFHRLFGYKRNTREQFYTYLKGGVT